MPNIDLLIDKTKSVVDFAIKGRDQLYEEKSSYSAKQRLEKLLVQQECPDCGHVQFCSEVLAVTVFGVHIIEALSMSLEQLSNWLEKIFSRLSPQAKEVIGFDKPTTGLHPQLDD